MKISWFISGDFNTILDFFEHKRGIFSYYASKSRLFKDFIIDNILLDLGTLDTGSLGVMVNLV